MGKSRLARKSERLHQLDVDDFDESEDASFASDDSDDTQLKWTHEYSPESAVRRPLLVLRDIAISIYQGREMAKRLFLRNIASSYRQTLLGFLWILLPVAIQIATWYFLAEQKILSISGANSQVPFLLFLSIGSVIWQTFFDSILAPLGSLQRNQTLLTKLNFPRETLVMIGLWEVMFNFAVRAVMITIMCLIYTIWFQGVIWTHLTLLAPLFLIGLIALGTSIGLALTPVGVLYQDIGRSLAMISPFWMVLTPVIYPAEQSSPLWIMVNPPAAMLSVARDLLVTGDTQLLPIALAWLLITIPMLLFGMVWYRMSFPILIERIAN
jgi:lipopolysaccharide transport system permease protein